MTRFWWLNPWAEIRRLRDLADFWCADAGSLMTAWSKEFTSCQCLKAENAALRRQIAEMDEQAAIEKRRADYIRRMAG